ncbi:MAG: 4-(cytidine 5'-diphospho)-2-C-methyl-D-erythritol kinase [Pseudomonadota bacterium]
MTADGAYGQELARAKINLFLHVRGQRPEGYHSLDMMVAFPRIGDLVEAEPASGLSLVVDGPFGDGLSAGADNLTLGAAEALAARMTPKPGAALRLTKNLPIAAGIGGGSADAGAALRLMSRLWPDAPVHALDNIAFALGADAPMCLAQTPAIVGGVGEKLAPAPPFPGFWVVLANPMIPLSTASVFQALERRSNPASPRPPARFHDLGHLVSWLSTCRNDLEAPARALCPVIGRVMSALSWDQECRFVRMSGSGATCFGVYETEAAANSAADRLRTAEPDWWVTAAEIEAWEG